MVKNPNRSDFVQACVKEFLKQDKNMDASTSNLVSEITSNVFGTWFEPLVERDDYLVFSMYTVDINNDRYKMKITAVGIWGKIIFTDFSKVDKEPDIMASEDEEGGVITEDASDYDFYYDNFDSGETISFYKKSDEDMFYEIRMPSGDLISYELIDEDPDFYIVLNNENNVKLALPKDLSSTRWVLNWNYGEDQWNDLLRVELHEFAGC